MTRRDIVLALAAVVLIAIAAGCEPDSTDFPLNIPHPPPTSTAAVNGGPMSSGSSSGGGTPTPTPTEDPCAGVTCSAFACREYAQTYLDLFGCPALDEDNDGRACETLPLCSASAGRATPAGAVVR